MDHVTRQTGLRQTDHVSRQTGLRQTHSRWPRSGSYSLWPILSGIEVARTHGGSEVARTHRGPEDAASERLLVGEQEDLVDALVVHLLLLLLLHKRSHRPHVAQPLLGHLAAERETKTKFSQIVQ